VAESAESAESAGAAGARLEDLLAASSLGTIEVWLVPEGLERPVCDVVVYETAEDLTACRDKVLLLIGQPAEEAAAVIGEAGAQRAAAVVVREQDPVRADLTAAAERSGVALLALSPQVAWARAVVALRGVLAVSGAKGEERPSHGDLGVLVNAVADAVGGSVTLFDPQQRVLASSRVSSGDDALRRGAVLDQHGPSWYRALLRQRGVYDRLWRTDEVIEIAPVPDHDVRRRLAVAVRAGDEILGSLWAAEGAVPLADDAGVTLLRSARATALHLLEHREHLDTERWFAENVARALLAGGVDAQAAARQLRVPPDSTCAVVSLQAMSDTPGLGRRLGDLLMLYAAAYRWTAVPVVSGTRTDLLLLDLASEDADRVRQHAELALASVDEGTRPTVVAGVGKTVDCLARVEESFAEADLVLRSLQRRQPRPRTVVATVQDVWAGVGLQVLADGARGRSEVSSGPLPRLVELDRRSRTEYVRTVRLYLESAGDVRAAARAMRLHPNTVRYRLRRARELTDLDLSDPEQRLLVEVQLRTGIVVAGGE
jgi:sugar diacid utilization regulator